MKRKIAAGVAAFALAVGGLVWASPAMADDDPALGDAIVQTEEVTTVTEETVVTEAPVEAVAEEGPAEEAKTEEVTAPEAESFTWPKEHKWYVCKYVGKPGVDERLQTGQNPIFVDEHSIEVSPVYIGATFSDKHGKSVVIAGPYEKKVDPEPSVADCPAPQGPPALSGTETEERSVCNLPLNGTATVTTFERKWTQEYVLVKGEWVLGEKVFGEWMPGKGIPKQVWDEDCEPEVVPVPAAFDAEPIAPTCDLDGGLPLIELAEHVTLTWDREFDGPGTYTLTATADEGYEFPDGTTVKTKDFVVLGAIGYQSEDPEVECYVDEPEQVTLATPSIHDECGTENDYAELPADSEGVTYYWFDEEDESELDVVAVIGEGYFVSDALPAGWAYLDEGVFIYEQADFTDQPCPSGTPTPTPKPTTLAVTGFDPAGPLTGAAALLLSGIGALVWRRVRA